jgi:hypothetical protein
LHNDTEQVQQLPDSGTVRVKLSIAFPNKLKQQWRSECHTLAISRKGKLSRTERDSR